MRIWLITVGEPLPQDEEKPRLLRTGMLAQLLVKLGHEVTWWTSAFDHQKKTHRSRTTASIEHQGQRIVLLAGRGYQKNISFKRIRHHQDMTAEFERMIREEPEPDVILCSMPLIELSYKATQYARQRGIPVILDLRDLWPDIFTQVLPGGLRTFADLFISPMRRQLRLACKNATALYGITPEFVDWGLKYAGRGRRQGDQHFWLAYPRGESRADLSQGLTFWKERGIVGGKEQFVACFFGVMSGKLNLETVIKAAREFEKTDSGRSIQFVICGDGEMLSRYQESAHGLKNVHFPGWVNGEQVSSLLRIASVGLAPYEDRLDFAMSVPTKVIEYLSAGLPVISSLTGTTQRLLETEKCGASYSNGDVQGFMTQILRLKTSPELYAATSQNAQRIFESEMTAESVYSKMAAALTSMARHERMARK